MNKPVAWIDKDFNVDFDEQGWAIVTPHKDKSAFIPLYTHPVKELTDEEINDIAQECWVYPKGEQAIFNQHKFAKAILKKAQEK